MKQTIEYLSIHIKNHESKQENMEIKLQYLSLNYDKLEFDSNMHYNIILGFSWNSQYMEGFPSVSTNSMKDHAVEKGTIKQIVIALSE